MQFRVTFRELETLFSKYRNMIKQLDLKDPKGVKEMLKGIKEIGLL